MALVTAAQFRAQYPQLVGTADDTTIDALLAEVDGLLALFLGFPVPDAGARTLGSATYTFYGNEPHHEERRKLSLPILPVVSVTSVNIDTDEFHAAGTLVDPTEYVLDGQRGEVWLLPSASHAWAFTGRANKVVVVAGFASAPPDLIALIRATARHVWDRRRTTGVAAQVVAGASQTLADVSELIPESVRRLLAPYVVWSSRAG